MALCDSSWQKKEIVYFERITSSDKKTHVEYGFSLTGKGQRRKQFLEFIAEGTRPNQLLLTEAIDRNVDVLFPVSDWFENVLTLLSAESKIANLEIVFLANQLGDDKSFTDFLSEILKIAVTGIDGIQTKEVELDFDRYFPSMSKMERDEFLDEFLEKDENTAILDTSEGKQLILYKNECDKIRLIQLITQHFHEDGNLINFTIEEESEGTQRLINLIPALFMLKEESEKIIFLDEIDRRLHPLLSYLFIQLVLNYRGKNNQLIFTTHDTNLLDLELLRRDEIWFVEKNQQGASTLYSLAEFKTRADLKIEKGYLNGRFGAIPFFGNLESLGVNKKDSAMETLAKLL